uniref:Uncharacterized protein n=1 Tax=Nicotiana tabacum TaxID=4097 RepID=A0A1S3ZEV5_TOBAC|nr:PREDICTED: uncharacterized protein LOC107785965 [Nicotiana tabacum]
MDPPEVHRMVGRPKVKRKRENDEARKREGVWSASRKGLVMTCGHCGNRNYNIRKGPLVGGCSHDVQDVPQITPQDSQNSEYAFMPTPGLRMFTSPVHESTQASSSILPENKQRKKSVVPKVCYQQFDVSQGTLQQSVASQDIL